MFHQRTRSLSLTTALLLALGVTVAACGSDDASQESSASPTTEVAPATDAPMTSEAPGDEDHGEEDHDHGDEAHGDEAHGDEAHGDEGHDEPGHGEVEGATEVDEPMPRLSVADSESGTLELLDLVEGSVLASFDATGPAYLSTDGRIVYLIDYEGGSVTVVDTGSWVVDHGDHSHAYIAEPTVLGQRDGDRPAHVVSNEGLTTIFFDGTGVAEVFEEKAIVAGELEPAFTIETALPHHGVVIPFAGHFVVTIPGATSEDLPVGVEVRHDDGEVEASFEDCPELHGEAAFDDGVLLACEDGLLWVTGDEGAWDAEKLAYPDGTPAGDRTWSFAHEHGVPVVAGALGETALLVVDTSTDEARRIELPSAPVAVAIADDGAHLVGLTADGQLHLIEAATGTIESSGPVLDAIDTAAEDGPPAPSIVVAGQRAYVSDPVNGSIIEVAYADDMRVARTFDLGVVPARLALTGAA
jgi:hypothetical protein